MGLEITTPRPRVTCSLPTKLARCPLILLIIKNDIACCVKSLQNPFEAGSFVLQIETGKLREGQKLFGNSGVESQILDPLKTRLCVCSPGPCGCQGGECSVTLVNLEMVFCAPSLLLKCFYTENSIIA